MRSKTERKSRYEETLDRDIARLLLDDPTLTQKAIGEKLRREEGVIQRRMDYMRETVLCKSIAVLDWEAIGLPLRFRIDIQIAQKALLDAKNGGGPTDYSGPPLRTQESVAKFIGRDLVAYAVSIMEEEPALKNLGEQLFVEDVIILLGNPSADLCAIVRARSHAAVLKFVTSGLRMMRGVYSTATYQEAWSFKKLKSPLGAGR